MKNLLAAASLVFSPALASADALDVLRAMSGGVEIVVPAAPHAVAVNKKLVEPAKAAQGQSKPGEVNGEGSVHGSASFNYRGGSGAIGREAGRLGGGGVPKSIPVEGEILVTGPEGSEGRIKVYGSVMLFGGGTAPNTQAFVGGSGPLYKDGKVVGTAEVSGRGPANVSLMGDAHGRASAVITVTGTFKPGAN